MFDLLYNSFWSELDHILAAGVTPVTYIFASFNALFYFILTFLTLQKGLIFTSIWNMKKVGTGTGE